MCADAIGIIAALRRFDPKMEEVFLGINENGYLGGRLENYAEKAELDRLAVKIHNVLLSIGELYVQNKDISPYEFALLLETKQQQWWNPDL